MSGVVILSPHCDDAPLSIGAALIEGTFGERPHVPIVFSVSRYTKDCLSETKQVTEMRTTEELLASRRAGYSVEFLGFPEPFVRPGFDSCDDVIDLRRRAEDDPIWAEVRATLAHVLSRQYRLVIAPLGCGGHIDHRIVHKSVLELLGPTTMIGFYEDLPYASYLVEDQILERIPRYLGLDFAPFIVSRGLEKKLELLEVYRSQLAKEQFDAISRHWNRVGGERLWLPPQCMIT